MCVCVLVYSRCDGLIQVCRCSPLCQVGILDVDLCGPSIPRMLNVGRPEVHQCDSGWVPVYTDAQKSLALMSIGFLLEDPDEAVIWRGPKKTGRLFSDWGLESGVQTFWGEDCGRFLQLRPLKSLCDCHFSNCIQSESDVAGAYPPPHIMSECGLTSRSFDVPLALIGQFVSDVAWGELDILLVDTPPGTSDEHLAVLENLKKHKVDGAILVTTPQVLQGGV